jgi:flagellar biosynthesis chaperone FliJ
MISIPLTEDRSEPIEFEVEEWEPSWAAAQREVEKLKRLMDGVLTPQRSDGSRKDGTNKRAD